MKTITKTVTLSIFLMFTATLSAQQRALDIGTLFMILPDPSAPTQRRELLFNSEKIKNRQLSADRYDVRNGCMSFNDGNLDREMCYWSRKDVQKFFVSEHDRFGIGTQNINFFYDNGIFRTDTIYKLGGGYTFKPEDFYLMSGLPKEMQPEIKNTFSKDEYALYSFLNKRRERPFESKQANLYLALLRDVLIISSNRMVEK